MSERMVQHGLLKRGEEFQLCRADADVPNKQVVWVPESLAAKQGRILSDYHEFQAELWRFWSPGSSDNSGENTKPEEAS